MIEAGVGFVPEDRKTQGLILEWPTGANIVLPTLPKISTFGVRRSRAESRIAGESLKAAGVVGSIENAAVSLSGGNQQKVVLAKWIAAGSRILLLNQPTRGVDVGSKAEIYQLIKNLCVHEGAAALIVSREIAELQGLCDRILIMSCGRLVAELPPDTTEEEVLAACVGI